MLQMQEGETVYDYCWYPFMSSLDPDTCWYDSSHLKDSEILNTLHLESMTYKYESECMSGSLFSYREKCQWLLSKLICFNS